MLETLAYSAAVAAALAVASAAVVGLLRRASVMGPLLEAEKRRSIWLRLPALLLWLVAVLLGAWYLNVFLASIHPWVGYGVGALAAAALTALGIGVALL